MITMVKYINILLFAGMLVMNYLANALPLNNKTTGELSDSFPNLFVPAGLLFPSGESSTFSFLPTVSFSLPDQTRRLFLK